MAFLVTGSHDYIIIIEETRIMYRNLIRIHQWKKPCWRSGRWCEDKVKIENIRSAWSWRFSFVDLLQDRI